MGLLSTLVSPFMGDGRVSILLLATYFVGFFALLIVGNVFKQLLFKNPKEPPVVFHIVPFIGSTIEYGIDPVKFFDKCKAKVGRLSTHT
jgi:sterol 14-demethylase